jgi:hypothetical protein
MATSTYAEMIQGAYVAYYGRWADVDGLKFWTGVLTANGGNLESLINQFGNSDEYLDNYSAFLTADGEIWNYSGMINQLYQQMFNRNSDPAGLEFYTELLKSGQSSLGEIAIDIYNGAQNGDLIVLQNKVAVASHGTAQIEFMGAPYTPEMIPDVQAILSSVTAEQSSVVAATVAASTYIDESTQPDRLFTLQEVEVAPPLPVEKVLMWGYSP